MLPATTKYVRVACRPYPRSSTPSSVLSGTPELSLRHREEVARVSLADDFGDMK